MVEPKAGDLEQVAIHVSDRGKPIKLTSATGKVAVFDGEDENEAPLALVSDKLVARCGCSAWPAMS